MKRTQVCSISLPDDLLRTIDNARDDVSRSRFILRVLEKQLNVGNKK